MARLSPEIPVQTCRLLSKDTLAAAPNLMSLPVFASGVNEMPKVSIAKDKLHPIKCSISNHLRFSTEIKQRQDVEISNRV